MLRGKILITGGTGTLGNAIVREALFEDWPCEITIYSRSEYRQSVMRAAHPQLRFVLGDIRDTERTAAAVAGHDIVIHAAAMKRLPECEVQPAECIASNVEGAASVLHACLRGAVPLLIGISTDKACRASTVYGASKLLLEGMYRNAPEGMTKVVLCRYGNVLASNGSVIPIWAKQAKEKLPLTITDRRCTRFWMSERDAVRTIVSASHLEHGECYIPAMQSLSIARMAQYLHPQSDVVETGLRSLEKLHEDLVHSDEPVEPTAGGFVLSATRGRTGTSYTSEHAPTINRDQFFRMLGDF